MKKTRMTIPQASLTLRKPYRWVYDQLVSGKLGARFEDGHWSLDADAVAAFARERQHAEADSAND